MIDCRHIEAKELYRFGLSFSDPEDAEKFARFIRDMVLEEILTSALREPSPELMRYCMDIKDPDEQDRFLKRNINNYRKVCDEAIQKVAWYVIANRDCYKPVKVEHNKEKEQTSIDDLPLSEETRMFLHLYGLDTVSDIITSGDLSYLQKVYPQKAQGFLWTVLDFLYPKVSPPKFNYVDLMSVLNKKRSEPPENILFHLKLYLQTQAVLYKCGIIDEGCFYANTYSMTAASELLRMKGVFVRKLPKDRTLLENAQKIWIETEAVTAEPWMEDFLKHSGDIADAMAWFFEVTDSLYIPMEYYLPVGAFSDFDDETEEIPKVIKRIESTTECFILVPKCTDIDQLTAQSDPPKAEYRFSFEDGTAATFRCEQYRNHQYEGTGIIEGYMSKNDRIVIEQDGDNYYFCFDWIQAPKLDVWLQTVSHPVPHPKWDRYNTAVAEKTKAVLEAYKKQRQVLMEESGTINT